MAEEKRETQAKEVPTPEVQTTNAEDYFNAYTNAVTVAHTLFDFQLHLGEVRVLSAENITAERFATIMMSPIHAKLFLRHLQGNLELYESRFGEIKLPEEIVAQIGNITFKAE